ncbi:hypothetical protein L9F63_005045, partial [Diploptera punctata]
SITHKQIHRLSGLKSRYSERVEVFFTRNLISESSAFCMLNSDMNLSLICQISTMEK